MTASIRLHVQGPLEAGAVAATDAEQAHYLAHVMRCAVGTRVILFNGCDGEWAASIARLRRGEAELAVETCLRPQQAGPDLWLAFSLLKRNATDFLVQKATELGAARLVPVLTARSGAERINADRLARIAREAAEQCERLDLPDIAAPAPLPAVLAAWPPDRTLHAAIERERAPPLRPASGPAALLVGPEGGFAPAELDALRAHPFVLPVSLGPLILRAETAAIVGLARLQAPS